MTASFHRNTCFPNRFQRFYINFGRRKQRFPERASEFIIVCIQTFLRHFKYFSDKGKSVAVHAGRGDADQHVSRFDMLSADQIFFIHDTDRKTGQIIFIFRIKARHFRRFPAD